MYESRFKVCLGVWLRLFFKVLFILKCIKKIFIFLFLKNYFWDQRIKTIQNIKKINFLEIRAGPRFQTLSYLFSLRVLI
jgi:hypothetical protein